MEKTVFALRTLIEIGQRDNSIGNQMEAASLAHFVFDAYEGMLTRRKITQSNAPLDNFLTTLNQLL